MSILGLELSQRNINLPLLEVHLEAPGMCPTTFSGLSQDTRKQGLVCGQCGAR